jgi:hypothetical protein
VLSKFEGDRKVSDQPLFLLLPLNQKGVLRATTPVNDLNPDTVPPCFTPRPLERSPQEIGTQVDSTVSPLPEGRFAIQISIAERAFAGCRMVGELNIPVFSNLVQDRSVTLKNGESTDFAFSVNKTANTSSRLMVKLTILE